MSEHKSSKNNTNPFDLLKRLLDAPHLLPNENKEEFLQLFDSLEAYGKAASRSAGTRVAA